MLEFKGYEGTRVSFRKEDVAAVVDCHGRCAVYLKGDSTEHFLIYETYEDVLKKIRCSNLHKGDPVWVRQSSNNPWVVRIYAGKEQKCYHDGLYESETLTVWDEIKPFEQGVDPNER